MLQDTATTQIQEIDSALHTNLTALKEGFFDLLAAFILFIIAFCSCIHAVFRIMFTTLGLILWALALLVVFLYWLRAWVVSKSSSSLHTRR